MSAKVCLPSGDGHAGAPTAVYREYLPKRLHSDFDEYFATHKWKWSPAHEESYFPPQFAKKFANTEGFDPSVGTPIAWDAALRLKEYDRAGIACEVLNPDDQNSNDPPFGSGIANTALCAEEFTPDLVRAGARSYNRWLADFCSADPKRLLGLTILGTLDDVNWCVEELHRAHAGGLTTGVLLPLDYYLPLYHHKRYDMLWEACIELNLTIQVHISKGNPVYHSDDPVTELMMATWEAKWYGQRPLWCLIFGGVFDRYPDLRVGFAEFGCDWVAPLLSKLDGFTSAVKGYRVQRDGPNRVELNLTPTEYFKRQCFVAHSAFQRRPEFEGDAFAEIPNMIWGADVGHAEGIWPAVGDPTRDRDTLAPCEDAVKALLGGLRYEDMRGYLTDNFFRAYPSTDRPALEAIAQRIGPTVEQLGLA